MSSRYVPMHYSPNRLSNGIVADCIEELIGLRGIAELAIQENYSVSKFAQTIKKFPLPTYEQNLKKYGLTMDGETLSAVKVINHYVEYINLAAKNHTLDLKKLQNTVNRVYRICFDEKPFP
jgi:hypothetical protein